MAEASSKHTEDENMNHPQKPGTIWFGDKYIHGPRRKSPKNFIEFRLSKPSKRGVRQVLGYNKKTGLWERQSTLYPKDQYEEAQYEHEGKLHTFVRPKQSPFKMYKDPKTKRKYLKRPGYKKIWRRKRTGGGQRYTVRVTT